MVKFLYRLRSTLSSADTDSESESNTDTGIDTNTDTESDSDVEFQAPKQRKDGIRRTVPEARDSEESRQVDGDECMKCALRDFQKWNEDILTELNTLKIAIDAAEVASEV